MFGPTVDFPATADFVLKNMNEDACLEQIQELATNSLNASYVMNQHRIHKYCKRVLESLEFVRQFKTQYLMTKGDLESLKYLRSVVNSAVTNFGIYRSRSSELTRIVMQHALDEQGIVDHNEILVGAVQKITSIRKKILVERADEDVADFKEDYDHFIRSKETILDWTPTNAMKLDLKLKLDSQLNQSISRAKTRKIQFQFRVPLNEIQKIQEVGHGIYSTTHKIRFHGEIAVLKQLNPIIYSEGAVKAFYKEVQIMKALIHPRILMFQGVVHDQLTIGLILEFMEMGSLQQAFSNIPQFSPMDILHISLDIAVGVNFLHLRNMLHRYLKPTNVYLDRHLRAKIGDFGLAAIRRESASSTRALPSNSSTRGQMESCVCTYQAPESLGLRAKYTEESDVYSIGMIMYQMVIWNDPFQEMQDFEIKRFIQAKNRPNIPEQSFGLEGIIKSCWDHEVNLRPRCRDLILDVEKLLAQQATTHLITDEVIISKQKARNNQLKNNDLVEECPPQLIQAGPYAPLTTNGTPDDFLPQEYTVYKFDEEVNAESTSITPELAQKIGAEKILHDREPDTRILFQNKDRIVHIINDSGCVPE